MFGFYEFGEGMFAGVGYEGVAYQQTPIDTVTVTDTIVPLKGVYHRITILDIITLTDSFIRYLNGGRIRFDKIFKPINTIWTKVIKTTTTSGEGN